MPTNPTTTAPAYYYCTQTDVENVLSRVGARSLIDDIGQLSIDTDLQQIWTDALTDAVATVDFYCGMRYDASWLQTSPLVRLWAKVLAAYEICRHRLNPIPPTLIDWAADVEGKLERVQLGTNIPNLPLRRVGAPLWSNWRLNPLNNFRVIRVETRTSSRRPQTTLTQDRDHQDLYSTEII